MSRPLSSRSDEKDGAQEPRKSYKVVLEDVMQPKKIAKVTASYRQAAPPGYTYVAFGQGGIGTQCLQVCKDQGLDYFEVYEPPHHGFENDNNEVAHHLRRVGYHFPRKVVDDEIQKYNHDLDHRRTNNRASGRTYGQNEHKSRKQLLRQERELLRARALEIFPLIPKEALDHVGARANLQGTVGTASNLDPSRRAQLAVGACIRHQYTNYDQLLKVIDRDPARLQIAPMVTAKIIEWRGEQEQGLAELEETFREVIYIDDDDEGEVADQDEEDDDDDDDDNDDKFLTEQHVGSNKTVAPHDAAYHSSLLSGASQGRNDGRASRDSSVEFIEERPSSKGQHVAAQPLHHYPQQLQASRKAWETDLAPGGQVYQNGIASHELPAGPWHSAHDSHVYKEMGSAPTHRSYDSRTAPGHSYGDGRAPRPLAPYIPFQGYMPHKPPSGLRNAHLHYEEPSHIVYPSIETNTFPTSKKRKHSQTDVSEISNPLNAPRLSRQVYR